MKIPCVWDEVRERTKMLREKEEEGVRGERERASERKREREVSETGAETEGSVRDKDRQTDRQRERDRERDRQTETDREREECQRQRRSTFDVLLSSANKLSRQGGTNMINFQSCTTKCTNHAATIEWHNDLQA